MTRAFSTERRKLNELRTLSRQVYEGLEAATLTQRDLLAAGQLLETRRYLEASVKAMEAVADRLGVR